MDDYNFNNEDSLDENLSQENLPAIDGQIGMEELLIREDENSSSGEEEYIPPMDNQISLDDYFAKDSVFKNKDKILNGDELGIFNNKKTESLNDFFKINDDEESEDVSSLINKNDTNLEEGLSALEDNNNINNSNNNYDNSYGNNNDNNYKDYNNQTNGEVINSNNNIDNYAESYENRDNTNFDANDNANDNFNVDNNEALNNFFPANNEEQNNDYVESSYNNKNEFSEDLETNYDENNSLNNFENISIETKNVNNQFNDNNQYNENNYESDKLDETYGGNASNEDIAFSYSGENNQEDNYKEEKTDIENVYTENNYIENKEIKNNDIENSINNTYENNAYEEKISNDNLKLQEEDEIELEENKNNEDNLSNFDTLEDNNGNNLNIEDNNTNSNEENNDFEVDAIKPEEIQNKSTFTNKPSIKNINQQNKVNKNQSENFEIKDENAKIIEDVDNLNKDYEDVDITVGRDAFGDYDDSTLVTGKIDESEEVDIKEKKYNENDGQDVVDGMLYKNLDTVLHESMIPYSEHVILDRALPRVEDGLKPVQRRILYSMLELGVTPDKPYRKSARIVGDCLGKYHPHGDSSVYDAMVRMAQPFNTNMLLVSGHGNFGSVDGDGAAAMRYTEARLAPISMELLRDLDKNTVKWGLNFDDTLKEPEILPGRFPNLLVNGATGIAVGLATNIPPHNLAEAIDGVVAYLGNPSISLKEMLKIIKGPDFPTGAYVLNNSELYQAYETGRGKIYLRAKMHIESNGNDKRYIVITELPYQVNKSSLLQKIANYKDEDKFGFGGISEVRDESDREGLRAVIRLKKDADLKAIYKSLLKNTELQTTFGINMVAIANGKPKQMGLLDIISYYAEYQREIILRRSKYELEQAKEREHILTGLIIAIKNIDAVIKIIKTSQNTTEAKKRLKEKFSLSDRQAQAILDMRLAKLTSLEVYKLEQELKQLRELIKKLSAIIASKKLQKEIVKDELLQIKRQYKTDRKTRFAKFEEDISSAPEPKEEANQKVVILKNAQNNFKCVSLKQYNYAQKDVNDNSTLFDTHTLKFETETNNTIIAFSSLGNCFKLDVKDFTLSRYRDKGVPENNIFKELANNETIVAIFDYSVTAKEGNFIFLTKYGMIKKTPFNEYTLLKKYYQGMKLKDDDEILSIYIEPKNYTYIFVTKQGMVLNAANDDVPIQGRISGGVKGINLSNNDYCIGASLALDGGEILAVTNKGYAKRVLVSNVDKSARYRKGLKFFTFTSDNGKELVFANVVTIPYTLGCVDNEGTLHYRNTDHIPIENRIGKGKVVDKMKKSLTIVKSFAINN